jgi:hypothetical protein
MTLKFMDGFESYANVADLQQAYPGSIDNGSLTFPTDGRRAGTKCLDWDSGYTNTYVYFPVNSNTFAVSEYAIVGFAFKSKQLLAGYDCSFLLDNGGSADGGGMAFRFKSGGSSLSIEYCRQFGTSVIDNIPFELNRWYYLEVKCKIGNGTDGHIVVRLDEQELVNWTGDNQHLGGFQISRFFVHFHSYQDIQIDDLYIAGSNGSYNNDFLGDVRVDAINPNGAGNHTDLTPSTGSNYECVNEAIIDESDYVEGANAGDKDSYSYPNVPTDLDDTGIYAVEINTISQRTAASDNIKIDGFIRTGSTDYNASDDLSLADSWSKKSFIFERDPSDSNVWTQAKINACEFGMEVG